MDPAAPGLTGPAAAAAAREQPLARRQMRQPTDRTQRKRTAELAEPEAAPAATAGRAATRRRVPPLRSDLGVLLRRPRLMGVTGARRATRLAPAVREASRLLPLPAPLVGLEETRRPPRPKTASTAASPTALEAAAGRSAAPAVQSAGQAQPPMLSWAVPPPRPLLAPLKRVGLAATAPAPAGMAHRAV